MGAEDISRGRSYNEISKAPLKLMKKHFGSEELEKHVIPVQKVREILKSDEIRLPDASDSEVITHPEFKDYLYQRKIGNEWHTKMMVGIPNLPIKPMR